MKLNNHSYCHKRIRLLCYQLELLSGMKLVTDLSEEFEEVRFVDEFGYIIIDYWHNACFTLSHKMSKKEWETVEDLLLYLGWLNIPNMRKDLFGEEKKESKYYNCVTFSKKGRQRKKVSVE